MWGKLSPNSSFRIRSLCRRPVPLFTDSPGGGAVFMLVEPLPITWLQGWPLQGGSLYFLGLVWRQSLALRSLRCSFLQACGVQRLRTAVS